MRAIKTLLSFLGYWLAATMALHSGMLWVLESLFPERWYALALSAGLAFVGVIMVVYGERSN
jgi:hypothetical protein